TFATCDSRLATRTVSSRDARTARRGLFKNFRNRAGADRAAAFTNREPRALFERDRLVQFRRDAGVVTRHHHFDSLRQLERAGDVGGADVELRTVTVEERRV